MVSVTNFGARLVELVVPNKEGKETDVILGCNSLQEFIDADERYLGSAIGRYANRIGGGEFELDGVTYKLAQNNGPNHLHGGGIGFDKKLWHPKTHDGSTLLRG